MEALDLVVDRKLQRGQKLLERLHECVSCFGTRPSIALAVASKRRTTLKLVSPVDAPPMWARVGRGETDLRTLHQVWTDRCYEYPGLRRPDVIVDVGANAGYATRWFADTFPAATVVAVEPDAANVELLERNTAHLANVRRVAAALSDRSGEVDLVDVGSGPWGMRAGPAGVGAGTVVGRVPCVSVPDLMERYSIDHIDYLKVDIEGGEMEVFADASAWIDDVDAIAIELHDRFRPGCSRAFFVATSAFRNEWSRGEEVFVWR